MKEWNFTDEKTSILDAYRHERDDGAYTKIAKKYKDPATKYSFAVLEGNFLTSRAIKLDAFRHLQDLRRAEADDFPYVYDLDKARMICQFAALCPNPDSGKPTPLDLWQLAILCKIEGWRRKDNGQPRFSDVIVSVARTNGKTYLATILILYHFILSIDGEHNQDLAYVAITSSQTDKGWRYIMSAARMLSGVPGFKQLFKRRQIRVVSDKIADHDENRLLKMSEQSGVFDSFHFTFCVSDEAGSNEMPVQRIAENKGKITTGMTQSSGQVIQISTAYPDAGSYLYNAEKLAITAMEKDADRTLDDHLAMIWQQDDVKEVHDPKTWIKSNPLIGLNHEKGVTMTRNLISKRDSAYQAGNIKEFENKSLNVWLQAKVNSYLSLEDIEAAVVKKAPIDITGSDCFIGIDLSHFSDDTALAFVFPYVDDDGNSRFYVYQHSFVPTARSQGSIAIKSAKDGINYEAAASAGFATIAKNAYGYIDDDTVYNYLIDFIVDHELSIKYFLYDAWEASPLIERILQYGNSDGWQIMPVRQGTLSLSQPTTYFRRQMDTRKVDYLDDPILKYALKNAILLQDNHGIKIDKDRATSKIDAVDAIIDCFFRAQYYFDGTNPDAKAPTRQNPFQGWTEEQKHNYFSNYKF